MKILIKKTKVVAARLAVCYTALAATAAGCHAAPSENGSAPTLAEPQAATQSGLAYTLNDKGLATLSYNGQSLFAYPYNGYLGPTNRTPKFAKGDNAAVLVNDRTPDCDFDKTLQKLILTYSWGKIACTYSRQVDRLLMKVDATNTSPDTTISDLQIHLTDIVFPTVPRGQILDAGMWGTGNGLHPLAAFPLAAYARQMPPVIGVDYGSGVLALCNENSTDAATVEIPFSSNHPLDTMYPLCLLQGALKPGETKNSTVSLRFGPPGANWVDTVRDVIARYARAYPFQLKWSDHRPIGALFLATSQAHPDKNPRGWFLNAKDIDVTTKEGRANWRERLLKYADDSIKVLKEINAQGMLTWDPEGQEWGQSVFYGDPRLTDTLAPETAEKGESGLEAIDEYFKKFRDADLRVGICLRPQEIKMVDGKPVQEESPDPLQTLKDKVAYAKKRWGCTLFYVDSTYDKNGVMDADVFKGLNDAFPDVLLMPENEDLRDYAYSAPLNSFVHHGVTSTPFGAREVYPRAFSVLLASATKEKFAEHHAELLAAVKHGDILIVNAWYGGEHTQGVKSLYEEAAKP